MRDARVIGWLASSLQDLRHGVILLRRDAGVSALIVLVLALGIGASTAMFSFIHPMLLHPLLYPRADRLVVIEKRRDPQRASGRGFVAGVPGLLQASFGLLRCWGIRLRVLFFSPAWRQPEQIAGVFGDAECFPVCSGLRPH